MLYIPIIGGSTRRDRQSIKVARFVLSRLQQRKNAATELLDLLEYNFPIMEERLHRRPEDERSVRQRHGPSRAAEEATDRSER